MTKETACRLVTEHLIAVSDHDELKEHILSRPFGVLAWIKLNLWLGDWKDIIHRNSGEKLPTEVNSDDFYELVLSELKQHFEIKNQTCVA